MAKVKSTTKKDNYFKSSWKELRAVRWPNRKTTWKLFFSIIGYTAIFIVLIMLLDALFNLIFSKIL